MRKGWIIYVNDRCLDLSRKVRAIESHVNQTIEGQVLKNIDYI